MTIESITLGGGCFWCSIPFIGGLLCGSKPEEEKKESTEDSPSEDSPVKSTQEDKTLSKTSTENTSGKTDEISQAAPVAPAQPLAQTGCKKSRKHKRKHRR